MIESLTLPNDVLGFVCHGHVTRADYETVLVPAVEKALTRPGRVRLYYEVAPDFDGFAPGAMWEDFKVGIEHLRRWDRMAVVTDVDWMKHSIRMFGFLLPGRLKIYPLAEAAQARAWITGD